MRLVFISDTHMRHDLLEVPACDLLIHAGDFSRIGSHPEVETFLRWFSAQPGREKVLVAGNHDGFCEQSPDLFRAMARDAGVHYLCDEETRVCGLRIWGSPMTPRFGDWYFNRDRGADIRRHWDLIPEGLDVLITHGPPAGLGDRTFYGALAGCEDLLARVRQVRPRLHVYGHIHEAFGEFALPGLPTRFLNVANVCHQIRGVRPPVQLELEPRSRDAAAEFHSMSTSVTAPARLGTTRLPDGRELGWAEWGPTSGTPVLLCPGAATSRWLGFGADALERRNVRLISVDRPGLGASTPAPGRTLRDQATDIDHLASARGLSGLAAVAFSQGAPFALACAAAGAVTGVAIVSGGDELAHPDLRGKLHPEVAKLVELTAADASRAESFFAGMTAQMMWDMVIGMSSEADRAVYTEPGFAAAYQRALSEAFSQGAAGYARDTVLAMSPWPFDPGAIRVPVDLWYGGLDTSPVHSPDHGEMLARRIPTARRHFLPQAGGALLWTHGEDILESLLARLQTARG